MADMDKKRFLELLHSYELGIAITEEELKELELFLIENDEYLDEIKSFQPVIEQLLKNGEIRETISKLAMPDNDKSSATQSGKSTSRRSFTKWVPIFGILIIAFFLVLKPWKIEISSTDEAYALENRLAILSFINIGDQSDSLGTAEMIRNLLISDLSESDYFRVVSSQRLRDARHSLGLDDQPIIDKTAAFQIADEIAAEWLLTGSILQNSSQFILTGELVDITSGNIIGSQRVIGQPEESIFSLIDKMSKLVKEDLPLPVEAKKEQDRNVSDITTKSEMAYQLYLKGVDNYSKFYNEDALNNFWSALQYDSTLAMAYYYMSLLQRGNSAKDFINKAVEYSENAGRADRHFIRSRMALLSGDSDKAINELIKLLAFYPDDKNIYYRISTLFRREDKLDKAIFYSKEALKIDPDFGEAINQLAYIYVDLGENNKAIETINRYISLFPNEANPYDSKGELYLRMGKKDLAIKSFQEALKVKDDFGPSIRSLARLYLSAGKFKEAKDCFTKLCKSNDFFLQRTGILGKATIFQFKGQFSNAINELDSLIAKLSSDKPNGFSATNISFAYFTKSKILAELGDYSGALESFKNYSDLFRKVNSLEIFSFQYYYAYLLQKAGETDRANQVIKNLEVASTKTNIEAREFLVANGLVNFARGNYKEATQYFIKDLKQGERFYSSYMLGRCYVELGQFNDVIKIFENQMDIYYFFHQFSDIWDVKMQYYLGIAYELKGDNEKAKGHYEKFLDLWIDADPDIAEILDARERLTKLKQISSLAD